MHSGTDPCAIAVFKSFVVAEAEIVAGWGEGCPRDVEPAGAGQELVGEGVVAQEVDQVLELRGVFRADVGSLAEQVLGVADTTNEGVHATVAEARVDDDGADFKAGRFQEHQAAIGHVRHVLHGGFVVGVFVDVEELRQRKVRR